MLDGNFVRTAILFVALVQTIVAQTAGGDQFTVSFDRPVQIGSQTLPSGTYTVSKVTSAAQSSVLEFSSGGTKLDTTFTQIPSLESTAPTKTKVILEDEGDGVRLSRIWVQEKNYGYEFPGKTEPVAVGSLTSSDSPQNYVRPATKSELAEVQTVETPAPTPAALQAQAQTQPAPITPAPQNPPPVVDQTAPAPVTNTQPIPATALGWASILFAGLTVAAAGLILFLRSERSAR
jgi:hypothetical protein